MDFVKTVTKVLPRDNGSQSGVNAMITSLGRSAFINGKSIFDCPYDFKSEQAELWMDAYQNAEKNGR